MSVTLESIGSRLSKYLKSKGIGVNELGRITQTSGAQISNILNGKNFGVTKLIKLIESCEDLNLLWLIKGEGEMLLSDAETGSGTASSLQDIIGLHTKMKIDTLLEENQKLKNDLQEARQKSENLEGSNLYKDLTIEAYKTTIDVLSTSNKDLRDFIEVLKSSETDINRNKRIA